MDFKGQKLAKIIVFLIMFVSGSTGSMAGYVIKSFKFTLGIILFGFVVSGLTTIPDWGVFKVDPVKWTPISKKK